MNPQPEPYIGNLFALAFAVAVAIYSYKAYLECKTINLDRFVIGYLEDYAYIEEPKPVRKQRSVPVAPKVTKKNKPVKTPVVNKPTTTTTTTTTLPPKPQRDEQLYNDCISSLVALGYKKTEAKNKTKKIFDDHNVTSIQEFIKFVTINTINI